MEPESREQIRENESSLRESAASGKKGLFKKHVNHAAVGKISSQKQKSNSDPNTRKTSTQRCIYIIPFVKMKGN